MLKLERERYNYRNKGHILYDKRYLDFICTIGNAFIYSPIITLLLEDIKSLVFIVLVLFSQYK